MPPGSFGGRSGFGGVPLTYNRGATTKKELTIDWTYPVYTPPQQPTVGTRTAPERKALATAEAFRIIASADERPLLILREFPTFDDPGNEKLSRMLFTERTVLLSHWFHCVRLPPHVVKPDHPFHEIFVLPDRELPQLIMASADGEEVTPFDYERPRTRLDQVMIGVLQQHYEKNPSRVLGELLSMLPKFDRLDNQIQQLKERLDRSIEKDGPRSPKTRKITRELARAEEARRQLEARKEELRAIPLKSEVTSRD